MGEGRIGDGAVSTDDPAIASGHIYKKVVYIARGCTVWASLLHKKLTYSPNTLATPNTAILEMLHIHIAYYCIALLKWCHIFPLWTMLLK